MAFRMVSGDSTDHGHRRRLWLQHMLYTSAWSLVAVETLDIYAASCHFTGHGHQHGCSADHRSV